MARRIHTTELGFITCDDLSELGAGKEVWLSVVSGDHWLSNYRSITTLHPSSPVENETVVVELYVVAMEDTLLDRIYSVRRETIRIDWAAYPHYDAPEVFAPFILDDLRLYYVNAFENAASIMETSVVAAEKVARLILSRISGEMAPSPSNLKSYNFNKHGLHLDL